MNTKSVNNYDETHEEVKPINIIAGPIVTDKDFFGRKKELTSLKQTLDTKKISLIIPGPRRWGKSSFVSEFMRINSDSYIFMYLQLQSVQTTAEFFRYFASVLKKISDENALFLKVSGDIKEKVNNVVSIVKKLSVGPFSIETNKETESSEDLLSTLNNTLEKFPSYEIVLVIDEISDFIIDLENKIGKSECLAFLRWLRFLRQNYGLQMILTGSINITSEVKRLNAEDLINDMKLIKLKPFTETESILFFKSLLRSKELEITDDAFEFCKTKILDGIPYFIQVIADEISKEFEKGEVITDRLMIEKIYNKDVIGENRPAFSSFNKRFSKFLSENEAKVARKILANLVDSNIDFEDIYNIVHPLINEDRECLHRVLQRLNDEGYIILDDSKYRFISITLEDYWRKHFLYER